MDLTRLTRQAHAPRSSQSSRQVAVKDRLPSGKRNGSSDLTRKPESQERRYRIPAGSFR